MDYDKMTDNELSQALEAMKEEAVQQIYGLGIIRNIDAFLSGCETDQITIEASITFPSELSLKRTHIGSDMEYSVWDEDGPLLSVTELSAVYPPVVSIFHPGAWIDVLAACARQVMIKSFDNFTPADRRASDKG